MIIVVVTLGLCIIVPLAVRIFLVEAFRIPGASGAPNVVIGDHLFVSKYFYWLNEPCPGELIVFRYPKDPSKDFIKRIVAVAGDRVKVDFYNRLVVNGDPVPRKQLAGPCTFDTYEEGGWRRVQCKAFEEHLGQQQYSIIHTGGIRGGFDETTVPAGHVFVMGDNRDNSADSRFWGTVPLANIKGRASLIWWSANGERGVRTERMGTWLHSD